MEKFPLKNIDNLGTAVEQVKQEIESLHKENANLRAQLENWNEAEEIAKREAQLMDLRAHSWSYPKHARAQVADFMAKHYALNHTITHSFTEEAICTICECVCSCGQKLTFYN